MYERVFVSEYFKNPFLWWGLILWGLTTFHAALISNLALQNIVIHSLHVPILFTCLTIAVILAFVPIRKSLRKLYWKKETKKEAIVYLTLLALVLFVQVVYFLPDAALIFSKLQPQVITDKDVFEDAIDTKSLAEYIALPLLYAFALTLVKTKLKNEGYETDYRFSNNLKFVAYVAAVNIGMYFVFIAINSLQLL